MTLEEFAKKAGVRITDCDAGWGGKIAYTTKESPNTKVCGYRTVNTAYKGWLRNTFGKSTAKALLKLMTP